MEEDELLGGGPHGTDVVHQLFVLHEAPPTEVTGPGAPGDGPRCWARGVADQTRPGGRPPLGEAGVGEHGGEERPPHHREGRRTDELCGG